MNDKLVVDSYTIPLDAELAKAYLESYEIQVSLEGDVIAGAAFALGPMLGGIRLFVDARDGERATALLKAYHESLKVPGVQTYESADALAARAFRTSLLGLILFPLILHIHAINLLLKVPRKALSKKGRFHFGIAWLICVTVLTAIITFAISRLN